MFKVNNLFIILRLGFYLTYFLNNQYYFLTGFLSYTFSTFVFLFFVFDEIESYKALKLEKGKNN